MAQYLIEGGYRDSLHSGLRKPNGNKMDNDVLIVFLIFGVLGSILGVALIREKYNTLWKWQRGAIPSPTASDIDYRCYWSWHATRLKSENAEEAEVLEFFKKEYIKALTKGFDNWLFEIFAMEAPIRSDRLSDVTLEIRQEIGEAPAPRR